MSLKPEVLQQVNHAHGVANSRRCRSDLGAIASGIEIDLIVEIRPHQRCRNEGLAIEPARKCVSAVTGV
jgi:hypothetical protein